MFFYVHAGGRKQAKNDGGPVRKRFVLALTIAVEWSDVPYLSYTIQSSHDTAFSGEFTTLPIELNKPHL